MAQEPENTQQETTEELEATLSGLEVRLAAARDGVVSAQRDFASWQKRARTDLAAVQREVNEFNVEERLAKHRETLYVLQREFEKAVRECDQTFRSRRQDLVDLRSEADQVKRSMAQDVSQYRRDIESLRSSMGTDLDRGVRLQQSWQMPHIPRGGGFRPGCTSILALIGAVVFLLVVCSTAGHIIPLLTTHH